MTISIKIAALFFLLIIVHISSGQTSFNYKNDFNKILEKTKDKHDSLSYIHLLERFNKNDTTLSNFEVLALLIGYTANPAYKPYRDLDTEKRLYDLNDKAEYKVALQFGKQFLKTHPVSVKALYEVSYAFHKLNQEDSAGYYLYRGQRIFQAMYFSGDGRSKDTPTFALGPADGQDYILKFAGGSIGTMGSGSDDKGNFLDILEAKFDNGNTLTLYFVIQHAATKMFE